MPGGHKNIRPEDGTNGWKPGKSGNPAGRPLSFKKKYAEIQRTKETTIWVDEADVKKRTVTRMIPTGKKDKKRKALTEKTKVVQYGLKLNGIEAILAKMDKLIDSKNEKVTWEVLKFLWEQHDGKAAQPLTGANPNEPVVIEYQIPDNGRKKKAK